MFSVSTIQVHSVLLQWKQKSAFRIMFESCVQDLTRAAMVADLWDASVQAALTTDPTLTPKLFAIEQAKSIQMGGFVPPIFLWHRFAGYDDVFTRIDKCRAHYAQNGLGAEYVDQFIR